MADQIKRRLDQLAGSIKTHDPEAEREWQRAVQTLDLIAAIIANNPRWDDVAAQVAEHHPELSPYNAQLRVKQILIETDERGGPALWRRFEAMRG